MIKIKVFCFSALLASPIVSATAYESGYDSTRIHRRQINLQQLSPRAGSFQSAPQSKNFITPRQSLRPFKQWGANNGYCGEVSILQAGMNQGQWMSQYQARLICGTGLSQSGPDGFCASHSGTSNYNAQVLIENPNPGDQIFANAGMCLQNSRLEYELYDYSHSPAGMEGFKRYLSWIKAQVIAGKQVGIAILNRGGSDSQYDHEVSVSKIGTDHGVDDPTYYDDDVLYFDDHYSEAPYQQGFTFGSLAHSRQDANREESQMYSILIPGAFPVFSAAGGDGVHDNPRPIIASNFAFAVSGPADVDHVTLPVKLEIISSQTQGHPNPLDLLAGLNFETPGLGMGDRACTNEPPMSWMNIALQATVSDLIPGKAYNLYEYNFDRIVGTGTQAALAVPDQNFNALAALATHVTRFVADGSTLYSHTIETTSDKVVVFRCVRADAP